MPYKDPETHRKYLRRWRSRKKVELAQIKQDANRLPRALKIIKELQKNE